jgi:hypothetical protein
MDTRGTNRDVFRGRTAARIFQPSLGWKYPVVTFIEV